VHGAAKKYPLRFFCSFLSNRLKFQSEILATYLIIIYAHNTQHIISFQRFKVINVTVTAPGDFRVLENVQAIILSHSKLYAVQAKIINNTILQLL